MLNICVCGGGSLGHVCCGVLASHKDVRLSLFTKHPDLWSSNIVAEDNNGKQYSGEIAIISSSPEKAICDSDIILLCLPGFLIESTLKEIKPYIKKETIVGSIVSSTGFFFFSHEILNQETKLFGFQRVPFIARVAEYGHKGNLLGYKNSLSVAVENIEEKEVFRAEIEKLFYTPTTLLDSFYEAALTNSNPILHTGRLYAMWKDWNGGTRPECGLFYKEWDIKSAQTIIDMDKEFMALLDVLHIRKGVIPTLLDYYESTDAESLCNKIRSIPAFQKILSPMIETENGWIPDFKSRYFLEDFPYGLRFLVDLSQKYNLPNKKMKEVYKWGIKMIEEQ